MKQARRRKPASRASVRLPATFRLALGGWAAFLLVALAVHLGWTDSFDRAGLLLWRRAASHEPLGPGWLIPAFTFLTDLGSGVGRRVAAAIFVAVLLYKRKVWPTVPLLMATLSDWLVDRALKEFFARARPAVVPHVVAAGGYSFPSGHSFGAAATWISIGLALGAAGIDRRRHALYGCIALSMAIAFSRVWLGVHYPSDAIGGWLAGAGYACAVFALFNLKQVARR